jgi:hypothetical protein
LNRGDAETRRRGEREIRSSRQSFAGMRLARLAAPAKSQHTGLIELAPFKSAKDS